MIYLTINPYSPFNTIKHHSHLQRMWTGSRGGFYESWWTIRYIMYRFEINQDYKAVQIDNKHWENI